VVLHFWEAEGRVLLISLYCASFFMFEEVRVYVEG